MYHTILHSVAMPRTTAHYAVGITSIPNCSALHYILLRVSYAAMRCVVLFIELCLTMTYHAVFDLLQSDQTAGHKYVITNAIRAIQYIPIHHAAE